MKQNQNGQAVRCRGMPSKAIADIHYNRKTKRLKVTLVTGRTYEYIDVPRGGGGVVSVGLFKGRILQRLYSRPLRFPGNHARARH